MRGSWTASVLVAVLWLAGGTPVPAQDAPLGDSASDNLIMQASAATTWTDGATNVLVLEGPGTTLELDRTRMTADGAVVWLSPVKGSLLGEQQAQIALVGNAAIDQQGQVQRSGDRLFVTAAVRGVVRVTADRRSVTRSEDTELYKAARALRPPAADASGADLDNWLTAPPSPATSQPTSQPTTRRSVPQPIAFYADHTESVKTADGLVALVVTGNVKLFQRKTADESMEMQADRAVLFTALRDLREVGGASQFTKVEEAILAAYLEGDVRIVHTPGAKKPDARLHANRVYYDFETDRAILTDAVIQSIAPQQNIPIVIRARTVRQLSLGEYRAEKVKLTQSSFKTPSYDIGMRQAYVRQVDTGDPRYGTMVEYVGRDTTFDLFGTSVFWFPWVAGDFTERGGALRDIALEQSKKFGTGIKTDFGLFELLGKLPPKDTDATLSLDYFNERGPAVGLDGRYGGGFVTEQTKQPWMFQGKFESYVVNDHGEDDISRKRLLVDPEPDLRYRFNWEHQHFFPDNWQVQLTGALVSDPTFQEEWFRSLWERQRPLDTALYIKHQEQNQAYTFLYSVQPNDYVTSSTLMQEQTEIERVPELSYHLIGEPLGEDGLTFFSDNTVGGLRFQGSNSPIVFAAPAGTLSDEQERELIRRRQGFRATDSPGLPSYGRTGTPTRVTYRGDFRQELDYPVSLGQFRVVPYVVGRYTWYSQSPDPNESSNDRLFAGAGVRITTAFWRVDDTAKSDLWDIHRLRHVVEPEVNLFTSAQTTGREHLLEYDEPIDEVNDITAIQVALHQRWQTKRGGAGRWRSVDFLTLNVEGNFFNNKPPDDQLAPVAFRGLYFTSLPEASVPRNSINVDGTWRMSDTTAILADAQYSLDDNSLATASIGLAASRGDRLGYFIGVRYIDSGRFVPRAADGTLTPQDLHSVVATVALNYELSPKYTIAARQSFDFGERERVLSNYSIIRHFDRWYASITFRVDYIGEDSGVFFNVWPEGLGTAANASERLGEVFGR